MTHRLVAAPADLTARPVPWSAAVSAGAAAALVLGGFALLAVVPVVTTVVITSRHHPLRPLRWWAAGFAAVYTSGLVAWAVGPDRAPSLTKDLHPVHAALIVAAGLAYVVRWAIARWSVNRGR
ncbi:hypothetical protein [Microlunatus antarcticus]|uniref:Uncharacterized protein n=1 Tax=Microlunatus antarcticus TaxID=53388 RepID=A0A7W5JWL8_9ACTN|nr:hypothetical protein [Microlunatus antarcticus]MBB3327565.1 hypothetical protein [Microlunatus antarcticus]